MEGVSFERKAISLVVNWSKRSRIIEWGESKFEALIKAEKGRLMVNMDFILECRNKISDINHSIT